MDLIRLQITHEFIRPRVRLTWADLLFGLRQELVDPGALAKFAQDRLSAGAGADPALESLARLEPGRDPLPLAESLAAGEDAKSLDEIKAKWLCLALAWVWEHRDAYGEPLQTVEEIYADFGYPEQIAPFVRYMPTTESDLGSRELNEARLLQKWRRFVEGCAKLQSDADRPSGS